MPRRSRRRGRRAAWAAGGLVAGAALLAAHRGPERGHDLRTLGRLARGLRPCAVPPPDSVWATPVQAAPRDPRSDRWIASLGPEAPLRADFGGGAGVPITAVDWRQPMRSLEPVHAGNSDDVGYPIPDGLAVEREGRAHPARAVLWDPEACLSWELVEPFRVDGGWRASRAERIDLRAGPRTDAGWFTPQTRDAAPAPWHDGSGLPLLPLLARPDSEGPVGHALRLTAPRVQRAYVPPARWAASPARDPDLPPMGAHLRLRADFDCGALGPQAARLCAALQTHGAFLAERGHHVALEGARSEAWDPTDLATLAAIRVGDLEVLEAGPTLTYGEDGAAPPGP